MSEIEVHPEARWRALVGEHARSGESVAEFCERRSLKTPTFYQWRRRLAGVATPVPAGFLPIEIAARRSRRSSVSSASAGVEVVLEGGRRLRLERGFDPAVLAAAVTALEGDGPC